MASVRNTLFGGDEGYGGTDQCKYPGLQIKPCGIQLIPDFNHKNWDALNNDERLDLLIISMRDVGMDLSSALQNLIAPSKEVYTFLTYTAVRFYFGVQDLNEYSKALIKRINETLVNAERNGVNAKLNEVLRVMRLSNNINEEWAKFINQSRLVVAGKAPEEVLEKIALILRYAGVSMSELNALVGVINDIYEMDTPSGADSTASGTIDSWIKKVVIEPNKEIDKITNNAPSQQSSFKYDTSDAAKEQFVDNYTSTIEQPTIAIAYPSNVFQSFSKTYKKSGTLGKVMLILVVIAVIGATVVAVLRVSGMDSGQYISLAAVFTTLLLCIGLYVYAHIL